MKIKCPFCIGSALYYRDLEKQELIQHFKSFHGCTNEFAVSVSNLVFKIHEELDKLEKLKPTLSNETETDLTRTNRILTKIELLKSLLENEK